MPGCGGILRWIGCFRRRGKTNVTPPFVRLLIMVLLFLAPSGHAAAPNLDAFYPAGGARGSTNLVSAIGKIEPWPPHVWVQGEGVSFAAQTNKGKFVVTIADKAAPGPRLVRLYQPDGASEPRVFVVGTSREISEAETNNHFATAQPISAFPMTINGRLDKNGDVDSFAMEMRTGQWLQAHVDSHTLMSKADLLLRLVTTNGHQIAWNHDFATLDPKLTWRATTNSTVVLQVFGFAYPPGSDIGLTGGEAAMYRLHLSVTNEVPVICEPVTEKEPNDSRDVAEQVDLPVTLHGRISTASDHDRFRFTAKKGEIIEARIDAASFGSPLDAWLSIEDQVGQPFARNDDADASRDPRLEWKAPTNGNYIVTVGSLTHRGDDDFCYRLSLRKISPDYDATLAVNSIELTPGTTNELKLTLKRLRGFTNELRLVLPDWPEGITALATNLSLKESAATIQLTVATNALAFQGVVRVGVHDVVTGENRFLLYNLTTPGETGYNRLLVERSDALWLTVKQKQAASKAPEKK